MKMVQVIDGEIKQYELPNVGKLINGSSVSGYHLLDKETLKKEGWLPLEDLPPFYNDETQYLVNIGYEILEDRVIKLYKIETIEVETIIPSELDLIKKSQLKQDAVIEEILFSILPEILGGMGGE